MRDQEEELLMSEAHRRDLPRPRPRRSFWIEESGEWGLLGETEIEEMDEKAIMWVGSRLQYLYMMNMNMNTEILSHGFPFSLTVKSCTGNGMMMISMLAIQKVFSGVGQKLKPGSIAKIASLRNRPRQHRTRRIFANFENKMRTFKESRALNTAKHLVRGYYPMNMFKGKGKGRASGFAKGKGSFQKKGKGSSSVSAALTVTGKGSSSSGPQKPGNPARTGCFICGSKEHDFRACPEYWQTTS